jgi:hypothetical protein
VAFSFDSIPHDDLLKSVARRVADGAVLRLIKLWLKAPIEERDGDRKRRIVGGKGNKRGTPQGGVPMLIFRYTFEFSRYGLAAAASYILVAIGMIITTIYFLILVRRRHLVKIAAAPLGAEPPPGVAGAGGAMPL